MSSSNDSRNPSPLLRKSSLILLGVLAALVIFGTTTQTWIEVTITQQQVQQANLNISGSKTAVAVSALAMVALAAALASSIAGKIARVVTSVIMLLSAMGIIGVVVSIMANPSTAAMAEVGKATGVIGVANNATLTLFPVLTMVAAAVLALDSVLILWQGRLWSERSKYDVPAKGLPVSSNDGPADEIDSWDQLSRGEDPTI